MAGVEYGGNGAQFMENPISGGSEPSWLHRPTQIIGFWPFIKNEFLVGVDA